MANRIFLLNLLLTSSLSLGLLACNQRLQSTAQDPKNQTTTLSPQIETEPLINQPAPNSDSSTTEPIIEVPAKPTLAKKSEPLPADNKVKNAPSYQTETPKTAATPVAPPAAKNEQSKKIATTPAKAPIAQQKPDVKKETPPATASNFIITAYKTMVNEGKKLGAACNFYLQGVLKNLGFTVVGFLANDFDVAAKQMFKNYRVVSFTQSTELKRHLWSYRERTGFIFQWERSGGSPGHVGIVERIGEKLYIYQASLNSYTARVESTTLDKLLAVNGNRGLRVYSEFTK